MLAETNKAVVLAVTALSLPIVFLMPRKAPSEPPSEQPIESMPLAVDEEPMSNTMKGATP
jgi:hypothetical protein